MIRQLLNHHSVSTHSPYDCTLQESSFDDMTATRVRDVIILSRGTLERDNNNNNESTKAAQVQRKLY